MPPDQQHMLKAVIQLRRGIMLMQKVRTLLRPELLPIVKALKHMLLTLGRMLRVTGQKLMENIHMPKVIFLYHKTNHLTQKAVVQQQLVKVLIQKVDTLTGLEITVTLKETVQ